MGYSINLGAWNKVFAVPSCVAERYIKLASGSNIKVLLYYLNNAGRDLTVGEISKATGVREEDCEDALMFWSEAGLLKISDDGITPSEKTDSFSMGSADKSDRLDNTENGVSAVEINNQERIANSLKKIKLERSPDFYPKEIVAAIHTSTELDYLFEQCEKLYGRPLKHVERNMLMLLVDEIAIPVECALMLVDYCHSINKATPAYIKSIASDWVERDIMTVEKAETEIRKIVSLSNVEKDLKKMFELNSGFSKNQKHMIYKWTNDYGFSIEMIEEAFQRTLDKASKLSFPYMDKILESWHNKGIKAKDGLLSSESKLKAEKQGGKESSFDIDEITRASLEKYS